MMERKIYYNHRGFISLRFATKTMASVAPGRDSSWVVEWSLLLVTVKSSEVSPVIHWIFGLTGIVINNNNVNMIYSGFLCQRHK